MPALDGSLGPVVSRGLILRCNIFVAIRFDILIALSLIFWTSPFGRFALATYVSSIPSDFSGCLLNIFRQS